jgi:polar amino acid transport system substrate-binding protein
LLCGAARATGLARLVCGAVLASALFIAGCGGLSSAAGTFTPAHRDTLTVVTQPLPTAGFWLGVGDHPTGGMEYEMAKDLAHRFGLKHLVVRTESFSKIVGGDLDGADLALSLITPTDQRRQVLDFSTPYIQSPPALLVRTGTSVPDVHTAQKLRFVVGANTTFESIVDDVIQPDTAPLLIEDRNDELVALSTGRADVAMFDLPAAEAIAHDDPHLAVAARLANTEPIAAALPKGSGNVEAVSSALRAMQADGTIDSLAEQWLGISIADATNDVPLLRTTES